MKHIRYAFLATAASIAAAPSWAQTEVTIGTARDPNLAAQIVIADDQGFFEDAGLDAKIEFFQSGGDLMAAFVGGSVHIGSSGSTPTMILRNRPYPVSIISQIADISGAQQLIVREETQTLEDLEGKRIGVMRGTASEAFFESLVEDAGIDPDEFEQVNLGPTEMLQAFVSGDVDGIALWEPHTTRARSVGSGVTLASGTHSYFGGEENANRVYGDHAVLFTSDDFGEQNPGAVRSVLDALHSANEFIENERDEAAEILAEAFSLEVAEMADIMEANDYTLALDGTLVGDMNSVAAFLESRDRLSEPEDVRGWINPEPLSEVAPDEVSLR